MVTIRLSDEMESRLRTLMVLENRSKSEIIKSALNDYIGKNLPERSAYELGEGLFGRQSSGGNDLSTSYKDRLKTKLREKHSH